MAFVILRPESVNTWNGREQSFSDELKKYVRGTLPGFAIPEWVHVVDDLPVSLNHVLYIINTECDLVTENVHR